MNQPQERNWWNRNWKWFVPVGCFGALILIVGFGAMIVCLVFGFLKSSETYKQAVAKAKTNSAVIEALGSPIKEGFLFAEKNWGSSLRLTFEDIAFNMFEAVFKFSILLQL